MNLNIKKIAFAISVIFASSSYANDFMPQQVAEDKTLEAVNQLVEKPFIQQEINEENYISAEEQIQSEMETRGWNEGWQESHKRIFVVYSESFDSEDPSYDDAFISKRSQYAMMATMGAKAKMIEYMRTEMSAIDQLTAPGTDVHAQLNERYSKLEKKINSKNKKLVKLLSEVNKAEAEKLTGVTWDDRVQAYADALIKKLDDSYDAGKISAEKENAYEKAKQDYQISKNELDEIQTKASAIKGNVALESTSMVETLSKAPLMGAITLLQAESWNAEDERYEVAVLMVWSNKLEKAAQQVALGEPASLKPKKALTVHAWLKKQDPSVLVGARQYIDKEGIRWFIGAYSRPAEGSSSSIRKNKGIADIMAKKEAVMALYADLETHKQAKIAMQTRSGDLGGKDHTEIAESFSETTRQAIENRQVSGLSKLFSKTVKHPISKQKMFVVAYGVSSTSASQALRMEKSNYQSASSVIAKNTVNTALKEQLDKSLIKAKSMTAPSTNFTEQSTAVSENRNNGSSESKVISSFPEFDEDDF